MNIYEKLQNCRAQLITKDLKQTGLNKFSNYTYFELGDFLPKAIEIMDSLKMTAIFGFTKEEATLTVVNSETPEEKILFSTPSVIPQLKGTSDIQNIGASQTYMRRYLYTMMLEISEYDMVNTADPKENEAARKEREDIKKPYKQTTEPTKKEPTQAEIETIKDKTISEVQFEAIQSELDRTGYKAESICKGYKVAAIKDLTLEQWANAMKKLELVKTKPQTDLGL